uniref:Reverse transcriptase domain-containing protein n=1 Tax=Bionectria ochroleuca TaxID=29856 RepID=A0A8H7K2T9_BIOOC
MWEPRNWKMFKDEEVLSSALRAHPHCVWRPRGWSVRVLYVGNGRLSDWSAEPVMVVKDEDDPNVWAEQRLTTNYSKVEEKLPATLTTLMAELHDKLSDPRIGSSSQFDLKHAYWSISVHPNHRHVFAFNSAAHSLTELVKIAIGPIPKPLPEPSLLILSDSSGLVPLDSYMDGMFCKHENFETQWAFIRDHLLPRFLWSLLELSFKKVRLGFDAITAIGWEHQIGGKMFIKKARVEKLRNWPTPRDPTGVRAFLGALNPTQRWIKNCAEIARPLTRLTGNVDWIWAVSPRCTGFPRSGVQLSNPASINSLMIGRINEPGKTFMVSAMIDVS